MALPSQFRCAFGVDYTSKEPWGLSRPGFAAGASGPKSPKPCRPQGLRFRGLGSEV